VEAVIARYLEQVRAEGRTARSVAGVMERLRAMEQERALRKGRRRARRLRASAVFQGVVGIAASALSAVSAGTSIAATNAAQGAAQACRAASAAAKVGSSVLSKAGPHVDPHKHRAESLSLGRDAARARADEQESFTRAASQHRQALEVLERRVVEIMDRMGEALDAGGRAALSRR
jgi:hypothetical protein